MGRPKKTWRELPRNKLVTEEWLGSGAFGVVVKGQFEEDDGSVTPCAVKIHNCNYTLS